MTQHREPTRLLVAVAATIPQGLILAAEGENARAEIREMSCNPDEWTSLSDSMPKEPGFYVWEGEVVIEDGRGMGEYGGQGDCDFDWTGKWRIAGVRDLLTFNFFHSSHVCPRHGVEKKRDERGHLQCAECMGDLGRASAAKRSALRGQLERARMTDGGLAYPVIPTHAQLAEEAGPSLPLALTIRVPAFNEPRCATCKQVWDSSVHTGHRGTVHDQLTHDFVEPTEDPDFGKAPEDEWLQRYGPADGRLTPYTCRCGQLAPISLAPAREHVRSKHPPGDKPLDSPLPVRCSFKADGSRCKLEDGHGGVHLTEASVKGFARVSRNEADPPLVRCSHATPFARCLLLEGHQGAHTSEGAAARAKKGEPRYSTLDARVPVGKLPIDHEIRDEEADSRCSHTEEAHSSSCGARLLAEGSPGCDCSPVEARCRLEAGHEGRHQF